MKNGSISVTATAGLDGSNLKTADMRMDIPSFNGVIHGGRVTIPDGDGTAQVELGETRINGEVHVDKNKISVRGNLQQFDAVVRDFNTTNAQGSVTLDYARVAGTGNVSFSSKDGISVDATVKTLEVRSSDLKATGPQLNVDAAQTLIQGNGTFKLNSAGEMSLRGNLKMDTTLDSGSVQAGGQAGTITKGSRVIADVTELDFNKKDGFRVKGSGGLDVGVDGLKANTGVASLQGSAQIKGGGAFEMDTRTGPNLPAGLSVDLNVQDGRIKSPDGKLELDIAKGTKVKLRGAEVDFGANGAPTNMQLAQGSSFDGRLDGGKVSLPGMKGPVALSAGTSFKFQVDGVSADAGGLKRIQGRLQLNAVVDVAKLDMNSLRAQGARLELLQGGKARLQVDVERVVLRPDGSFDLSGTNIALNASVGNLSGRF